MDPSGTHSDADLRRCLSLAGLEDLSLDLDQVELTFQLSLAGLVDHSRT